MRRSEFEVTGRALARRVTAGAPALSVLALLGCGLLAGCGSRAETRTAAGASGRLAVALSPDPANSASQITAVFAGARGRDAKATFEWRRNGSVISGAAGDRLDPSFFSKNDEIEVAVRYLDPADASERHLRARVRVENTPPRITRVTLAASTASGSALLAANVESADPDHDAPTYAYRWLKNGGWVEGATGSSLPLSGLARGDQVVVEVSAHDAASASAPVRSDPFLVDNRPPVFTSQPLSPRASDAAFQYQAMAADPDGDPLRYEVVSGPAGISVDRSGNVFWMLPKGDQRGGEFPVRLRATDSKGGEAIQDFTVRLQPQPVKS